MIFKKIIQIIVIIFFFVGCASKKTVTEYKDKIVRDTIIKTKTITEVERYTDTLTIENPCDSITGNLKPFNQLLKIEQGNIKLTGINNVISAEIDLKGYKDILERTYQSKYDKLIKESNKEIIKYRTPFWVWIYIVLSVLVIFLLLRIRL